MVISKDVYWWIYSKKGHDQTARWFIHSSIAYEWLWEIYESYVRMNRKNQITTWLWRTVAVHGIVQPFLRSHTCENKNDPWQPSLICVKRHANMQITVCWAKRGKWFTINVGVHCRSEPFFCPFTCCEASRTSHILPCGKPIFVVV